MEEEKDIFSLGKGRLVKEGVFRAGEVKETPKIAGVRTGVEGLDELFYTTEVKEGEIRLKPLGGYPFRSVIHITGVPDTGKSLMVEQFTIKQAYLGYPVCFVTVEQPSAFLINALKQRALAMGYDYEELEDNIVLVDAATHSELRDNLSSLEKTLAFAIKKYDVRSCVIDSITGLYEAKEMMARQIVRRLYNFMKKWRQTALFVSQKRSGHEELTAEAAGGYAVGHIVDGTIILSKKEIMSRYEESIYKVPIGEMIRLFRIDGCRMAGHDTKVRILEILPQGLVRVGPPLEAIARK
ncbi:KaiC domain-containing protein [bacterium]|nr:KaiC domain-containing protein [bacterium]